METASNKGKDNGGEGVAYILPNRPKPKAPYPHMREVNGFLFLSGASSRLPNSVGFVGASATSTGLVFDVAAQTRAVIANLSNALAMAGGSLSDIVQVTCFLVDMNDMSAFNKAYAEFFDAASGPARTTVAVSQLPHPYIRVEINAIAVSRNGRKSSRL